MKTIKITWTCNHCEYKKSYWAWNTGACTPLKDQDDKAIQKHILKHQTI